MKSRVLWLTVTGCVLMMAACHEMLPKRLGKYDEPWKRPQTALILDAYAENALDWAELAAEPRVAGIIHKASQGLTADPAYQARKTEARLHGYVWGSYHLGQRGDPEQQADFYLNAVQPTADELIALDLESLEGSSAMTLDEAERFIQRIYDAIGRYPVVYGNHSVITALSARGPDSVFAKTPLWYARFRQDIPDFPTGVWPSYTLWQFSSEINVQIRIPGTRPDIDVNVFFGTREQLVQLWPFS